MSKFYDGHPYPSAAGYVREKSGKRCLVHKIAIGVFFVLTVTLAAGTVAYRAAAAEEITSGDITAGAASADTETPQTESEDISADVLLPEIFEVSLNMIYPNESPKKVQLKNSLRDLLAVGSEKEAAKMIGAAMAGERKKSMAYIGYYCRRALPYVNGGLGERAGFLSWFLSGYGKFGVVILSKEGIDKVMATGRRRGEFWRFVEDGKVPSNKLDRIYPSSDAFYIPFAAGEVFILDIIGSDSGEASLWKVLPGGINKKTWSAGTWEREITVRGDKLY